MSDLLLRGALLGGRALDSSGRVICRPLLRATGLAVVLRARVENEWQSTRPGRDTMAQTEKAASACDRARRPLVSRARHLQY